MNITLFTLLQWCRSGQTGLYVCGCGFQCCWVKRNKKNEINSQVLWSLSQDWISTVNVLREKKSQKCDSLHYYVAFSQRKMFYYTSKWHLKKSYIEYICKKKNKKLVELKLLETKVIDNVNKFSCLLHCNPKGKREKSVFCSCLESIDWRLQKGMQCWTK